jgi:flavin-dependent dehydrogenase
MVSTTVGVIGNGPAGTATALALRERGIEVVLIGDGCGWRAGEHLPPRAAPVLDSLRLGGIATAPPHRLCTGIDSRWGDGAGTRRDYVFSPWGPGLLVDRPVFDAALMAEVERRGGHVIAADRARSLTRRGSRWCLALASGAQLEPSIVIDATGRRAWVGRQAGAQFVVVDRLVGIWGLVRERPSITDSSLLIEAVADGWWYAAPLAEGQAAVALMTDADLLKGVGGAARLWTRAAEAAQALRGRFEALPPPGKLRVATARSQCLWPAAAEGWFAVGDAACALDPLSSAGMVKALRDGCAAAIRLRWSRNCAPAEGHPDQLGEDLLRQRRHVQLAQMRRHGSRLCGIGSNAPGDHSPLAPGSSGCPPRSAG